MLEEVGDKLSLTSQLRNLEVDDVEGFYDLLRHAVLHRVAPDVLGSDPSNTEGKDLLRALTFFMTLDHDRKVDVNTFSQAQTGALSEDLRNPFQNKERWTFFPAWAEALGFAESPLIGDMQARALVPDCRKAVRRTIQQLWPHRVEVHPRDFIDELLRALPVLPGGDYSRSLGFELPATTVSQTLSSALLAAHDDGVIVLSFQSDAADPVALWDPGEGRGVRLVSRVVVEEAA